MPIEANTKDLRLIESSFVQSPKTFIVVFIKGKIILYTRCDILYIKTLGFLLCLFIFD